MFWRKSQVNFDHPHKNEVNLDRYTEIKSTSAIRTETKSVVPLTKHNSFSSGTQKPSQFRFPDRNQFNFDPRTRKSSQFRPPTKKTSQFDPCDEIKSISIPNTKIKLTSTAHTRTNLISMFALKASNFRSALQNKVISDHALKYQVNHCACVRMMYSLVPVSYTHLTLSTILRV